jgi:Ca2+-transporting ATPase
VAFFLVAVAFVVSHAGSPAAMSSPVNNTVRIHVDSEGQSSQHDASSSNGHKSAVEMQSVGVNAATSSGKNATAESINVSDVNGSPDPTSPQAGLISETFPLSVENIQRLFNTETTPADVINIIDKEWGGVSGLMGSLNTQETGLDLDALATQSRSETERIAIYGQNVLPLAKKKSFLDFCWEVLEDTMLRILMVAGAISIGLGLAEDRQTGWYEGAAIWFAIILVTLVSAVNNYQQQKQFAEVDISKELDAVTVIRSGKQFSMDPTEILVGDLVALAAGQRIPADGVLIQMKGKEVKVNESSATGETGLVDKKPHTKPLMMSGTEVVSGSCIMLVVLVGINTSYGQTLASLVEEDRQTPLQKKLAYVATLIGWMGTGFAACTFIALLGYWIHEVAGHKPTTTEWSELLDIAVVCISIIVVAVPEGLPLAVTVSLAYSMKAMLKDHILVRELAACETMGNATAICQ